MQQLGIRRNPLLGTTLGFLWGCLILSMSLESAFADDTPGFGTLRLSGTDLEAIRLTTDVQIDVTGHLARTTITQRFRNPSSEWSSATYLLPLPDQAAVDSLEMMIGELKVVGEIRRKQQAEAEFKRAEAKGQRAALVSRARANLFNTAVSNIPPDGEVSITIEYQQTLERDGERFGLRLPLTLTPRYIGGDATDAVATDRMGNGWSAATDRVPDAPRITPAVLMSVPEDSHRLTLSVNLVAGVPLAEVLSDYHWIEVSESAPGRYHVTLANPDEPLDHDFSLHWRAQVAEQVAVTAFHHRGSDAADYLAFQLLPPSAGLGEAPPRELILVIDTSGSMQGVSMEQAKTAVQFAVSELRPVDRFNVIAFSDTPRPLFHAAMPADAGNVAEALHWVSRLSANGGTEMHAALSAAIESGDSATTLRQVIFVTDGAVGDEARLFEYIEQSLGRNRLFTVGIGSAPNGWFMRKAAELGRGSAVTISALGEVAERMRQLLSRLGAPTLTDLQVVWPQADVDQLPRTIPDLYAGEPIDFVARGHKLPEQIVVTGTLWRDGIPSQWRTQIGLQEHALPGGHGVAVAWANRKIESLVDDERRGLLSHDDTDFAITDIALTHHLVSRTTSLIAVAAEPVRLPSDKLRQRDVGNLQPYGQSLPIGQMTATGTAGPLHRLIGALSLLLSLLLLIASRCQGLLAGARQ